MVGDMGIRIAQFREEHTAAVARLNACLKAGGIAHQFPGTCHSLRLPPLPDRTLYVELFLALDDADMVHGGYALKHQEFRIGGKCISVGNLQLPLSEGTVHRAYTNVGGAVVPGCPWQKSAAFRPRRGRP